MNSPAWKKIDADTALQMAKQFSEEGIPKIENFRFIESPRLPVVNSMNAEVKKMVLAGMRKKRK